jgi:hypothetical protein
MPSICFVGVRRALVAAKVRAVAGWPFGTKAVQGGAHDVLRSVAHHSLFARVAGRRVSNSSARLNTPR